MLIKVLILVLAVTSIQAQDLECLYEQRNPQSPYTCDLRIDNPAGSDDFTAIPGVHLTGRSNADVELVNVVNQNTPIIPAIICRQFPNLRELFMPGSNVERLTDNAFLSCLNLRTIALIFNSLTEIPDNVFRNNWQLETIYLSWNSIEQIGTNAFTGSRMRQIELDSNNLGRIDSSWFESVNDTLNVLNIMSNGITVLPTLAFNNLRNLHILDVTANTFERVHPSAFWGLENLRILYMIQCNMNELTHFLFQDMRSLRELHVELNEISHLPDGVFNSLRNLRNIYLGELLDR
jgi:Leucine-rich repeat (LRR) protein